MIDPNTAATPDCKHLGYVDGGQQVAVAQWMVSR